MPGNGQNKSHKNMLTNSNKKIARIAGLLYLGVVITGIFSLAYVPSTLIVWDNAATTFANIKSSETLFRFGIIADYFATLSFFFYR
jgi:Domain of unknown function (DUF4386)